MAELSIRESNNGISFVVKVVPGSSRTAVAGLLDDMLKIKVASPPEKGKANQCLISFLAKRVGVKKNAVSINSGQTGPVKHVHIAGISEKTLLEMLNL